MNNFEIVNNEMSLEDVKFSYSNNFEITNVSKGNRIILASMLVGASIVMSNSSFASDDIFVSSENCINISEDYNKNVNVEIDKYINDISRIDLPEISKETIIKDILSYKSLNNNWDGYNSLPLETMSAINTINLIDLVGEKTFGKISNYYPNPNGTISLEWENSLGEILSIEVGNNSMSYFIKLLSEDVIFCNNIDINAKEANKISEIINVL